MRLAYGARTTIENLYGQHAACGPRSIQKMRDNLREKKRSLFTLKDTNAPPPRRRNEYRLTVGSSLQRDIYLLLMILSLMECFIVLWPIEQEVTLVLGTRGSI